MKHSKVKGKTLNFNAKTVYGEGFKADLKKRISNFLEAGYYDIENALTFEDKGGAFEAKADKLVKFFFNAEEAIAFEEKHVKEKALSVLTKDEKVNRYRLELVAPVLRFEYSLPSGGPLDGPCEVTFRSGGDYTVKREGKSELSYGPKLKAENFTESGFKMQMLNGATVAYELA